MSAEGRGPRVVGRRGEVGDVGWLAQSLSSRRAEAQVVTSSTSSTSSSSRRRCVSSWLSGRRRLASRGLVGRSSLSPKLQAREAAAPRPPAWAGVGNASALDAGGGVSRDGTSQRSTNNSVPIDDQLSDTKLMLMAGVLFFFNFLRDSSLGPSVLLMLINYR
jgi:hypothetical protein